MTDEQYEKLYDLAMSPGGRLVANGIIKSDLNSYAKWLTNRIIDHLMSDSYIAMTWDGDKHIDRIHFQARDYYHFYCRKEDRVIKLTVAGFCATLLYFSNGHHISLFKHKLGAKLGGFAEFMWTGNIEKARKRLLSIIKAGLIYSIYGKTH